MIFLLQEGTWLGQGLVDLYQYGSELRYYTKWKVSVAIDGQIIATQEVELADSHERTINRYTFLKTEDRDQFHVTLENEMFGKISGKGLISPESIAWEFHGPDLAFEGFELFQLQSDGSYASRAEYASEGELHSTITGTIWQKSEGNT